MLGQVGAGRQRGVGVRVARREQQRVRVGLRAVVERVDHDVAEAPWHHRAGEACEPREERHDREDADAEAEAPPVAEAAAVAGAEPRGEHQRRRREHPAERDRPAVLRHRLRELDVDRIAARVAEEAGVRVRGHPEVRVEMHRVAHERGVEVVHPAGRLGAHERGDPQHRREHQGGHRPHPEPDDVREREQQAEEDRQARALEGVGDGEPDRITEHSRRGYPSHRRRPQATVRTARPGGGIWRYAAGLNPAVLTDMWVRIPPRASSLRPDPAAAGSPAAAGPRCRPTSRRRCRRGPGGARRRRGRGSRRARSRG